MTQDEPVRTFAFVDMAGYTALTEQHGDVDAAECALRFYAMAESALRDDARIVKRIGDAVMLTSVRPAASVLSIFAMLARAAAEPQFLGLRAGLCAGPAVERDGDYFGGAVNLAARIGAHARAGEVLCNEIVANAATAEHLCRVVLLGEVALKNIAHPVGVWSLLSMTTTRDAPADAIDPVCRMHVRAPAVSLRFDGTTFVFCSDACADRFRLEPSAFVVEDAGSTGKTR